MKQIADKESRTRFFDSMLEGLTKEQVPSTSKETHQEEEQSQYDRYWMSKKHADTRDLTQWLNENKADRALNVSLVVLSITQR